MRVLINIIDKININILTVFLLVISFILGQGKLILMYYYVAIFHELFHLLACKIFKVNVVSFNILPLGVSMKVDNIDNVHSLKQIIIYLAGPLSCLVNILVFRLLYEYDFINQINYDYLSKINIIMALVNLLPIFPLDGYKIFNNILLTIFPYKKSLNISMFTSFISFVGFIFINLITNQITFTMFLLFEQIKNIFNFKYLYKRFLIHKTNYKKTKKYRIVKDYQMYKDINNYQFEKDKILNDFDIATIELKHYI